MSHPAQSCGRPLNLGLEEALYEIPSRQELASLAKVAGPGFLLLGCALALAAFGWFRRRLWGWRLAVVLIATQVTGDLFNLFRVHALEGIVGLTVAGGLPCYLCSKRVRGAFAAATH